MRVRVTKHSKNAALWYSAEVGNEFDVEDYDFFTYKVVSHLKWINKGDCEILTEPNELKQVAEAFPANAEGFDKQMTRLLILAAKQLLNQTAELQAQIAESRAAKILVLKKELEVQIEEKFPLTETYIQDVPDKCDRILWRGQYIHLPLQEAKPPTLPHWRETVSEDNPVLVNCGDKESSLLDGTMRNCTDYDPVKGYKAGEFRWKYAKRVPQSVVEKLLAGYSTTSGEE